MTPESQTGIWEAFVVLALGTAAIVALAAVCGRLVRPSVWQRTVWQAAVLGLLGLVAVEGSGAARALVAICRHAASDPPATVALPDVRGVESAARLDEVPSEVGDPAWWEFDDPARGSEDDSLIPGVAFSDLNSRRLTAAGAADRATEGTTTPRAGAEFDRRLSAAGYSGGNRGLVADLGWWAAFGWAAGTLLLVARIVHARLLLARFRRRGRHVEDAEFRRRMGRLASRLGVDRPVTVLEAAGLGSPVAFGIFQPTVALPAGFRSEFDAAEQEAMLAHELAHVAAGDPAWQLAADVVCAALWWHPAVWWAGRQLRAAGEVAADEASLMVPGGPDVLAGCLVTLGRQLAGPRRLGWLSMAGPPFRSGLGRRVHRLLNLPRGVRPAPRGWRPAAARGVLPVAMVTVAVLCTAWARPQVAFNQGETAMSVLNRSFARSLAAAVVAAALSPLASDAAEGPPDGPPRPDEVRQREGDRPRDADRDRGDEPRREGERERAERDRPERDRPAEARREEGPREEGRREPGPEAQALRREIEVLRLALPALREGERGDAIEILERAIRAREVTLEGRRDDEAHQIRERAPAPPQVAEILKMAAGLWREFNDPEKAEAIERLARELAAPRDRPPREGERRHDEPRREPMGDREFAERREQAERLGREMQELRERAAQLRRELGQPREEEARDELRAQYERTLDEMREIENRLRELRPPGRSSMGPPEMPEQAERRMQHLRVAIDNLHAAGLHEQAERLAREAEGLIREGRPGERPEGGPRPPEHREGRPQAPERLEGVIRELREQLERVQRELEELRRDRERMPRPHVEERDETSVSVPSQR